MRSETKARSSNLYREQDTWKGKPLYAALVTACKRRHRGVTVLRGVEGYGAHHQIHTLALRSCSGLPMIIEAVDTPTASTASFPSSMR